MGTYVICATPAHGHVTPLVTIARHLTQAGHRIVFLTSIRYEQHVRDSGAEFVALPADADVDLDDAASVPGRAGLTGPAAIRFDMLNLFLAPGASQYAALRRLLDDVEPDAVLTEPLFVGAALLAELPRTERPPIVALGILPLGVASRDTAPFGLGIAPMRGVPGRMRNAMLKVASERIVFGPVAAEANALAERAVGRPFSRFFLDWHSGADALIQFTVPAFEYPRSDLPATVTFAGPLPAPAAPTGTRPDWWDDIDGSRPVVHVTQGTVANADFALLVRPTIEALADRDVLVVVSTGGRSVDAVGAVPPNTRVAAYLPYAELLPRVDVFVTNGGYGGVQQALRHGIPLVVAGRTEDKIEVSARVGWSGAGIDLRTNTPSAAAVARAVDTVLGDVRYSDAAGAIGEEMQRSDALATVDSILTRVAADSAPLRSDGRRSSA